jgi:hypothetical protein
MKDEAMDATQAPNKIRVIDKALARWGAPRLALWWAVTMAAITCVYFRSDQPFASAATQYAMTCAIVERHTLHTDAYQMRGSVFDTCDRAYYKGHYYSDKSPVMSLLGVPAFALYRWASLAMADPAKPIQPYYTALQRLDREINYYIGFNVTTFSTAGLAAIALTAMLTVSLMRRGVRPAMAAAGGALWLIATPIVAYSVFFYGYSLACALILGANMLLTRHYDDPDFCRKRALFAAGLMMGLASWTLNTCALGALIMTVALALTALDGSSVASRLAPMWRRTWPWVLGGMLGVSGYFIYVRAVFGSFASPYRYEENDLFRAQMSQGLMGAGWPSWRVLWLTTFHRFQGLFVWFPITLLALGGLAWSAWNRSTRRGARVESLVALAFFVGILLYNSGYYMWWGGWAYAPRHLIPGLALLGLGLAACLGEGHQSPARTILVIGYASAIFNLAAVAINPHANPGIETEALLRPELILSWTCPYLGLQEGYWWSNCSDHTLGELLGFYGRASLVPLLAIWTVGLFVLYRIDRAFLFARWQAEQAEVAAEVAVTDAGDPSVAPHGQASDGPSISGNALSTAKLSE